MKNPFSVKTPETLKPKDIASLFVDVFSDFPRLLDPEHTFLHGARGTGKSMMLRYLEPQVQIAANKVKTASELPYYAVHIPIKSPSYALSELERLDGAPYWLLAEHFMICNVALRVLHSIKSVSETIEDINKKEFEALYLEFLDITSQKDDVSTLGSSRDAIFFLDSMRAILNGERSNAKKYMAQLTFSQELHPYKNALFGYEDFFLPFIRSIKSLQITPDAPIFLMIDDADNLPLRMQKILNNWVSYRTTNDVCLKISTQQRYRTWRTMQGVLIERAHDFSEINISAVYTSKHSSHYYDRVEKIVRRRLEIGQVECDDPLVFFPENEEQKKKIERIKKRLSEAWEKGDGVSSRKSDDLTRYTVSEYMKELTKFKKTNTYSYAGFKSLVDISSGMIRYFLEPASRMYAEVIATGNYTDITHIPNKIQDQVIYRWSEEYVLEEFEKLRQDENTEHVEARNKVDKLRNLISALGQCFQRKLLSDDSERRFLSFMITRPLSPDVQDVIDLAVEWGYLNIKSIARKEGAGRNILYTLNRRLAPYFKLDPSGYAAHMSLTPEHLNIAIKDPQKFIRARLKNDDSNGEFQGDQQMLNL